MKYKGKISDPKDLVTKKWTEDYVNENGGKINKIQVNGTDVPITNKAVNIEDVPVAYGICETAAGTAAKVATLNSAITNWTLKPGSIIGIKFTNANSASNVTLNVNGSGAKSIAYASTYPYTGTSTTYCGAANTVNFYMYDGTYWYFLAHGSDNNSDTIPSGYCTTAAATAAKTASCGYWTATANSYLHIVFRYANTSAGAITLNVNSTGAKPIYINGTASGTSNYDLKAGSYLAFYDGTNFYFRTDGKLTASITGDAATVNGKTVAVSVPSNAVFTDTKVTAVGNHYTPSGGSPTALTSSGTATRGSTVVMTGITKDAAGHITGVTGYTLPASDNTDTKNTAGSTDTSSKIFLVGATTQAANPQTYSHDTAYVGTDGCLYSGGVKVLTAHQDISGKENSSNKITSITSSSTDTQYPSAKAVYTLVGDIASALATI